MHDRLIDFLINLIASVIFTIGTNYFYKIKNFSKTKAKNYVKPNESYIRNIKREFYICFIPAVALSIMSLYKQSKIIGAFQMVVVIFLFIFTLFAFMCAMEIIDSIYNEKSNEKSSSIPQQGDDEI